MLRNVRHLILASATFFALFSTAAAQFTTVWEGDVSSDMNTAGNWDNGANNRSGQAVFNDPSAVTFQPDVPTGAQNNRTQLNALTFNQAGWNITTDGTTHVSFWGDGGTPFITSNGAGTNTIGSVRSAAGIGTVTTGSGNTLVIGDSSGAITIGTKLGDGTLVFGNDALLNDIPNIDAGSILVNSTSGTAAGNTRTIAGGALLGGTGGLGQQRDNPEYTFASGSTLAPGAQGIGDTAAGTLNFYTFLGNGFGSGPNFNINMQSNSTVAIDLFADGTSDKLLFSGDRAGSRSFLTIGTGVTLALSGTPAATTYTIAEFVEAGEYLSGNGTFSTITLNSMALTEGVDYTIAYNEHPAFAAGSGSIELTIIPEPQTYALLAGGLVLGLTILRRRR